MGALLAGVDAALIVGLSWGIDRLCGWAASDASRDPGLPVSMGVGLALLFVLGMKAQQLYIPASILNGGSQIRAAVATWFSALACLLVLAVLSHATGDLSPLPTAVLFLSGACVIPMSRTLAKRAMGKLVAENRLAGRRRILLIGDASVLAVTSIRTNLHRHGYNVLGEAALPLHGAGGQTLDAQFIARIRHFVREYRIHELFLAVDPGQQDRLADAVAALRVFPLPVHMICGPLLNALVSRPITDLGPHRAIELQRGPLTLGQRLAKRSLDLVLASVGLFVLAPFLVLVAALIKADSPGPALFRQRRAGFNGITFRIFKFRTMSTMDDGALVRQATRDDRRVTRIGRWLRRTSIDELPQLLNVLSGEMSLVGPRPHALSHDDQYDTSIGSYAFRHHMKPGITGWAQVNGCRGETSTLSAMRRRVDYDLWYIEHWSLKLDLISLGRTVIQLVRPSDVY